MMMDREKNRQDVEKIHFCIYVYFVALNFLRVCVCVKKKVAGRRWEENVSRTYRHVTFVFVVRAFFLLSSARIYFVRASPSSSWYSLPSSSSSSSFVTSQPSIWKNKTKRFISQGNISLWFYFLPSSLFQ